MCSEHICRRVVTLTYGFGGFRQTVHRLVDDHVRAHDRYPNDCVTLASYGLLLVANGLFSTLMGVRAPEGFDATATGLIMVESWLNGRTSNRIRGQVLSLYMITNYFCAGLGQFLLPLSDPGEFYLFCRCRSCCRLH